jgi:hypothetical protein
VAIVFLVLVVVAVVALAIALPIMFTRKTQQAAGSDPRSATAQTREKIAKVIASDPGNIFIFLRFNFILFFTILSSA